MKISYREAGIDIDGTDAAKKEMGKLLASEDPRFLNTGSGPFAALIDASFPELEEPVLVFKVEEPGSKQKMAAEAGRLPGVCFDMINHLVNDVIVMGARPLAVQDVIISGKQDDALTLRIVGAIAEACRRNGCVLTGGETSIQPKVLGEGTVVLSAAMLGIAEKREILDGRRIENGDLLVALASNGLHTNGYSLVRRLAESDPEFLRAECTTGSEEGETSASVLDVLLKPHVSYWGTVRKMLGAPWLHGLAHVTGGGIKDNLERILAAGANGAAVDLAALRGEPIFGIIRERGDVADAEMVRTFNMGVGMIAAVSPAGAEPFLGCVQEGVRAWEIGSIRGDCAPGRVELRGRVDWSRFA